MVACFRMYLCLPSIGHFNGYHSSSNYLHEGGGDGYPLLDMIIQLADQSSPVMFKDSVAARWSENTYLHHDPGWTRPR